MSKLTYEFLLHQFVRGGGMFIVGAGASTGITQFGNDFLSEPVFEYLQGGSFPVSVPPQTELKRRLINAARPRLVAQGTFDQQTSWRALDDFPYLEMAERVPARFARTRLMHSLAKPAHNRVRRDNYSVFEHFAPSLILNYNLDGLLRAARAAGHIVFNVHGTVPVGYGGPKIKEVLDTLREYELPVVDDDLIISVKESASDMALIERLDRIPPFRPRFIALVGYSFARNGEAFDDWISMRWLAQRFSGYRGEVYVLEPWPHRLQDTIAACLGSKTVHAVPAYWNLLSRAFMQMLAGRNSRSLNHMCEQALDRFGDQVAFLNGRIARMD